MVDDDQEDAHRDERIRQRWTVELSQHGQELDMLPCSPSLSPQQRESLTKTSAQRKRKGKRRKRTGKTVSCDVGSGKKLMKEEAEDACARPHSGTKLSVINEVNEDSTEEEDNDERNQTDNETANGNEKASIGGGGFSVPSPTIARVALISQSSSDSVNEDGNDNSTPGICRLNKNNGNKRQGGGWRGLVQSYFGGQPILSVPIPITMLYALHNSPWLSRHAGTYQYISY